MTPSEAGAAPGRVAGVPVALSRVVQGTLMLCDERQADELLSAVYAAGCTAFDTAHAYTDGASERLLGSWIERAGVRDRVVVVTKGGHPTRERGRLTRADITADLHESLDRLRTGCVDLYLLHRDDEGTPAGFFVDLLEEFRAAGLVRATGVSNWSHQRIAQARAHAAAHGLQPFAASSPHFSLADPRDLWPGCVSIAGPGGAAARAWYRDAALPVIAWSPLAGGFLTGRYRPDNLETFTERAARRPIDFYATPANFERLRRLQLLAAARGVPPAQAAVSYLFAHDLDLYVVTGALTGAEYRLNAAAAAAPLTSAETAWLDLADDVPPPAVGGPEPA